MPQASGSGRRAPNLLCVATLTPRKGHRLLLQALAVMGQTRKVIYVSGEESAEQVRLRAVRLGLGRGRRLGIAQGQIETLRADRRQDMRGFPDENDPLRRKCLDRKAAERARPALGIGKTLLKETSRWLMKAST